MLETRSNSHVVESSLSDYFLVSNRNHKVNYEVSLSLKTSCFSQIIHHCIWSRENTLPIILYTDLHVYACVRVYVCVCRVVSHMSRVSRMFLVLINVFFWIIYDELQECFVEFSLLISLKLIIAIRS